MGASVFQTRSLLQFPCCYSWLAFSEAETRTHTHRHGNNALDKMSRQREPTFPKWRHATQSIAAETNSLLSARVASVHAAIGLSMTTMRAIFRSSQNVALASILNFRRACCSLVIASPTRSSFKTYPQSQCQFSINILLLLIKYYVFDY